jgi:hypothetical protein
VTPVAPISAVVLALGLLALVLLLSACTPMHWDHPQLGAAETQADLTGCTQSAHQQAWRYGMADPLGYGPRYARGPDGRVFVDQAPRFPDPAVQEGQLRDYCMRAKGYRLVPDEKG